MLHEVNELGDQVIGRICGRVDREILYRIAHANRSWSKHLKARFTQAEIKNLVNYVKHPPPTAQWLFLSYSPSELPLGYTFKDFIRLNDGMRFQSEGTILAITQQMGFPFDVIPIGWKTVTLVNFIGGIPEFIESLPKTETYGPPVMEVLG